MALKDKMVSAWSGITGAVASGRDSIQSAIGSITGFFENLWGKVSDVVDKVKQKWQEMTSWVSSHTPDFSFNLPS
ncbi:hypothetical protein ACP3WD_24545, partial [Salmonella enterica]|uniref:hypothetical protein n=1 Tax=Salmonella enterica TaxID=28901 RepID=UPI003CEEB58B